VVPNEGTATSYVFGKPRQLEAGGKPLGAKSRIGLDVADWDDDGDLDLLTSGDDGSVAFYANVGSAQSPRLKAPVELVPPAQGARGRDIPKAVQRGTRAKICVADWNGDGRLDLLLGDFARQKPDRPKPTAEEQAEYDRIREELEPIRERYVELYEKLYGRAQLGGNEQREKLTKEQREKLTEEWQAAMQQMSELRARLPQEYERHGWVWLFLRQPQAASRE
jgi:hypothetical protein